MPTNSPVGILAQYAVSPPVEHGRRECPENPISHFVHKILATLWALPQKPSIKSFMMTVQLIARSPFSVFFWHFSNPFVFVCLPQGAFLSSSTMKRLVLALFNAAIKLGTIYTSIYILVGAIHSLTSGVDVNQAVLTASTHIAMVFLEMLSGYWLVFAHPEPLLVFDEDTWAKKFDRKFRDLWKDFTTLPSTLTLICCGLVVALSAGIYFYSQPSKEVGDGLSSGNVILIVMVFLFCWLFTYSMNGFRRRVREDFSNPD